VRALILHKCVPKAQDPLREMFAREPFGALERLVTRTLLDVGQRVTGERSADETWLRRLAQHNDRRDEQMRVMVLEFLEMDVFTLSANHCVTFLDPLIESWDIDLATFAMEVVLNRQLVRSEHTKTFEFMERKAAVELGEEEPGLQAFLQDSALSGDATVEEIEFLKTLRLRGPRPTPLYYYRELQNLRDPLHFHRGPSRPAALSEGVDMAIGRKGSEHSGHTTGD
jgi:hypothetical protein